MHRQTVYPGQILPETTLLNMTKDSMIGMAKLAAAVLGTNTLVNGLACGPTAPASMQVQVAAGEIYSLQNVDGTAFSSLAADTTHQILKQGLSMDAVNLSCPAPATAGQSINYLVQVTYQDVDANPTVLPYYNASNPAQAYSGPNNSGTSQSTVRQGVCQVAVKVGVAATSGTQVTPAPDPGYTGLYVVTVANGASTITGANISTYSGAPFLTENLTQKISQTTGDARYATQVGFQQNAYSVANAGGTADAITATYIPAVTALTNGMTLGVRASSANATTTPTFTPNSGTIPVKTIVKGNGLPLVAGDIAGGGHWVELQYDLTLDKWVLLNPALGVSIQPSGNGMKNKIINGAMKVDQRNGGAAQTITAAAALAYSVDRWYAYCTGANVTGQQVALSNGQNRYKFTGAASVTGVGFGQRIEAKNCLDMAGQTATLQVKAASSSLTTLNWAAYYASTTDSFGTLAAPTRTAIASGSFAIGSTEATYTTPISIPAAATTGIEIVFTGGALLASQTLQIGDVQLEASATATAFEQRPYGVEFSSCQRYYEVIGNESSGNYPIFDMNAASSATIYGFQVAFKVPKRTSPTVVKNGTWNASNCGQPAVVGANTQGANMNVTVAASGWISTSAGGVGQNLTVSAEL